MLLWTCVLALGWTATVSALYSASSGVVDLTSANFNAKVINSDEVWLVEFYAPWCGHCKSLVPEYQKAARALRGVVKVGAVNADEDKSLGGQYGIRGFPTIKIFGASKQTPEDFNGARTADGLVDAALAAAKKKVKAAMGGGSGGGGGSSSSSGGGGASDVVELTDANFDAKVLNSDEMWLVEFYAPWCGHCKNLAPHWAKAAGELKGKVRLGALDATVHTLKAQQYGVQGYPTIKFFPPGKKSDAEEYDGGRTSSDIVTWALDKLAANVAPPEVVQITDAAAFARHCDASTPLCVITVLPHIYDCQSRCRDDYLAVLRTLGDKYKQKMWGWLWTQAGDQAPLEESLDIGGFGYPAMAVVNVKKMKYALLRGSFSRQGIDEFLRDLSYGRGNTAPVRGAALAEIAAVAAWDGKDAEMPVEEELDLSDVDLDDDAPKDEL